MKKLFVIISLLFTLAIAGVLHDKHAQLDVIGTVSIDQANSNQFPVQMPDPGLNSVITGFIFY